MNYRYDIKNGKTRVKTNTKKYILSGLAIATLVAGLSIPALAADNGEAGAKGNIGYSAYELNRHAEFNVHQGSDRCSSDLNERNDSELDNSKDIIKTGHSNEATDKNDSNLNDNQKLCVCTTSWNISGAWKINVVYLGVTYPENLVLTQTISGLSGSITLVGGGSPWTITTGSVNGNMIEFTGFFNADPALKAHFNGTIASDGSIIGSWNDITVDSRVGTWMSTSSAAMESVIGCTGHGEFTYSDEDHAWYTVDVQYVKVSGHDTWFAGPVVSGNVGMGEWLFARVHDGGNPGNAGDKIWGSFTDKNSAKLGVALMSDPSDGPFLINSGNIVVRN